MSLHVLMQGVPMGTLRQDAHGNPHFAYTPEWHGAAGAFPLSLCLPLSAATHAPGAVAAVAWGLLPDNDNTLQGWAARFHVSPRNPVALLAHVGEDCAGAVQFVASERVEAVIAGQADGIEPLSDAQVAARLSQVRRDVGSGRWLGDIGQFSLAGAQAKIALLRTDDGWAVPSGRIPTTHILKPPGSDYNGFVENEMFCLRLARAMGMPAAFSEKIEMDGESAICVERYDRKRTAEDGSASTRRTSAKRWASCRRSSTRTRADPAPRTLRMSCGNTPAIRKKTWRCCSGPWRSTI